MKKIPLTQGKFALVDNKDFIFLRQWNWSLDRSKNTNYAIRGIRKKDGTKSTRRLHCELALRYGLRRLDHKNLNGLDNRWSNLREASVIQNAGNQPKTRGTSRFKGVHFLTREKCWRARIGYRKTYRVLGYFKDEVLAAKAYDEAARALFGPFARLNLS